MNIRMSQPIKAPKMVNSNELLEKLDKQNDLKTGHFIKIPDEIEQEVYEKGFYAYNWIGEEDVKNSLDRDYLKYLSVLTKVFIVLIFAFAFIFYISVESESIGLFLLFFKIFFWFVIFSNIGIILVIIGKAINRFRIFSKNAYVIFTDTHIYFNGGIKKYEHIWEKDKYFLEEISKTFEEPLFEKSNLETSKMKFMDGIFSIIPSTEYISNLLKYKYGIKRDNGGIFIIIIIGYILYFLSLIFAFALYVVSTIFIFVMGIIISAISKKVLIARGHDITIITNHFENISKNSLNLVKERKNLASLLDNAKSNDWQNSLEINIDESIKKINNYALNATNFSLDLRKTISNSNYKEMFNSGKYDVWIKGQIQKPLEGISDLLETNLISLKKQNNFIEQEIGKQTDEKHIGQLTLAQKRVVMKIEELGNSKRMIDEYVGKLVSG